MADDYAKLLYKDPDEAPGTFSTNIQPALLANRLSWYFDWTGPSVQLNTACSGSTIALDLACASLRRGQCSMALVAGVNTLLTPEGSLCLENMSFLSPDSKSYTFDQRANGYARGEGVVVLVLKRLRDAVRAGDVIRAVVRGSGSNQDGHTPGITQPSVAAQEQLIRSVYREAGVDFRATRYVEAHGTGTQLGDTTETNALGRVFRTVRSPKEPLIVGSVKTNIGHLEGASGLAGVVKSILILERGQIPPNALFEKLNTKIRAKLHNLQFPTKCMAWPAAGLRRISVNCFGFGGSNSHVILDDAFHTLEALDIRAIKHTPAAFHPAPASSVHGLATTNGFHANSLNASRNGEARSEVPQTQSLSSQVAPDFRLLIWSAKDEAGLKRVLQGYEEYYERQLGQAKDILSPLAYTLSARRSIMSWRSFTVVKHEAGGSAASSPRLAPAKPVRSSQKPGGLVFVFTGQGAQYARMGLDLLVYPVFHDMLSRASAIIAQLGAEWSLWDVLEDGTRLNEPQMSQPLCTVIQIALVELLSSFDITPDAVIGHSSGEIAAAYTIGALSLESAIRIAYHRGRLAQRLLSPTSTPGAMVSVNISEADVDGYLRQRQPPLRGAVAVACINSPVNVTLSGDEAAVDELLVHLDADGIFARKLTTGVAYHSQAMQQLADDYLACLGALQPPQASRNAAPAITMISSVTGLTAAPPSLSKADYWVANLVSPVRFADALQYLAVAAPQVDGLTSPSTYIEIGPHAALKRPVSDTLTEARKGQPFSYLPALSRHEPPTKSVLAVVGALFSAGYHVSVTHANQQGEGPAAAASSSGTTSSSSSNSSSSNRRAWPFLVDTPAYPFDHAQRHWHETRLSRGWRFRDGAAPRSVLGVRATDWNPLEPRWRKMLRTAELPWLADHVIGGSDNANGNALFPAAGMINMALEAVRQTAHARHDIAAYRIREASFQKPIIIRADGDNEVVTRLRPWQAKQAHDKAVRGFHVALYTVGEPHNNHNNNNNDNDNDDGGDIDNDDVWTECATFAVHVDYHEGANDVDGGDEPRLAAESVARRYAQGVLAATTPVSRDDFYAWGRKQGLQWANLFALAEDVRWDGDRVATAVVKVDPPAVEPYEGIVHPAVLDSAFQVIYVPASHGAARDIPTIIPYKFKNVWIAATGWQHPHTRLIRALGNSQMRPNGLGIECTIDLLSEARTPLCHIEAVMLPVMDHSPGDDGPDRRLLRLVDWKPVLSLLDVDQLRQYCEAGYTAPDEAGAVEAARRLERCLRSFVHENIGQLRQIDRQKMAPHMQSYVSHLQALAIDGESPLEAHGAEDFSPPATECGQWEAELESLRATTPAAGLFFKVTKNLLPLVRGEVDAGDVLVASPLAQEFYEDVLGRYHDPRLMAFLDLAAHQGPALRVIEFGAGQGAMAHLVLSMLTKIEERSGGIVLDEYVYTDASDLNLHKARARFSAYQHRMDFHVFDLKRDQNPAQAFQPGSFDLVLAGGALYIANDLPAALQGLRLLLKPHGHIALCAAAAPPCFPLQFAFGLSPDWWSTDGQGRMSRQTLTQPEWDGILGKNGFSGTDLVIRDYQDAAAHRASIIVSTASPLPSPAEAAAPTDTNTKVVLIVAAGHGRQPDPLVSQVEEAAHRLTADVLVVALDQLQDTELGAGDSVVFLADLGGSLLAGMSSPAFAIIQRLVHKTRQLVWVTTGFTDAESRAGVQDGFLRTLRAEFHEKRIVSIAVEDVDRASSPDITQMTTVLGSALDKDSAELEYVIREGRVLAGRLVEAAHLNQRLSASLRPTTQISSWLPGPPLKLHVGSRGRLDTLHFREDAAAYHELGPTDVEIEAKAWAVNFRDVFAALGRLDDPGFGFDCAGIVTRVGPECTSAVQPGDRVCMCLWDCMRTYPRTREPAAVVKLPPSMSFEAACAVVIPGMTAWHALVEVARLETGEKVLIHAAAGATGQLAVQIAQLRGAEVFATVGHADKKELLMREYGVPADHIFYSRSGNAAFAQGVRRMTDGYGVDVVLNSLMGAGLRASWECLAPYGRFVEIGKADINDDAALPMRQFANNATFAAVDIRHMIVERPRMANRLFQKVMQLAIEGTIHAPAPLRVFDVDAVEDAFRYIQGGKNAGRAIIRMEAATQVQKHLLTRSSWTFDAHASYVVVGGLGGIGRSILRWMASRGAKHLIVPSRSGAASAAATGVVGELREKGVRITTPVCDISSWDSLCSAAQEWSETMPTVRGCINAAMVLNDAVFENMSHSQWDQTLRSKVDTSWNLHKLFPDVDFLIFLSSISGILGNPGQANYAAGCTFQDALARHRTLHGHKTISIDLGVMRSIGVVAESASLQKHLGKGTRGLGEIEEEELLALLDQCCDPAPETSSKTPLPSQIVMGLETPSDYLARGLDLPPGEVLRRPLFAHFGQTPLSADGKPGGGGGPGGEANFAALFRQQQQQQGSIGARVGIVAQALQRRLARALGIEADDIDVEKPLHAYGVDSLVAVELRNAIAKDFAADVPVFELVGGRTVQGVAEFVEERSQIGRESRKDPVTNGE